MWFTFYFIVLPLFNTSCNLVGLGNVWLRFIFILYSLTWVWRTLSLVLWKLYRGDFIFLSSLYLKGAKPWKYIIGWYAYHKIGEMGSGSTPTMRYDEMGSGDTPSTRLMKWERVERLPRDIIKWERVVCLPRDTIKWERVYAYHEI